MSAPAAVVPAEVVLRFLESQVARHRALAPRVTHAAVTFAVESERDGLTDYWTLYVTPRGANLERGAPPLEYVGPVVTLHATDRALSSVTRGEAIAGLEADGDTDVLRSLAACFSPPKSPIGVRAKR